MPLPRRTHSLSHGRPPLKSTLSNHKPNLSSRHTRRLIRTHHNLQKNLASALSNSNIAHASSISAKIEAQGGLEWYQLASKTGQRRERGGDASGVLIKWLKGRGVGRRELRMLDVGALSVDTAASRSGIFREIVRIDLKSQERGILEQDFMERPLPEVEGERFDIVCLSLVVNYVAEAKGRGEMLKRSGSFLSMVVEEDEEEWEGLESEIKDEVKRTSPYLFIVLPAPCVLNSRYLTHARFASMMVSLGYEVVEQKTSAKLAYWLCVWKGESKKTGEKFKKTIVNDGKGRNNFAIVLDGG